MKKIILFLSILALTSHNSLGMWELCTTSKSGSINCLESSDGILYGGTSNTTFIISTNKGVSWEVKSEGLPNRKVVYDIALLNNYIFLCIEDKGIFRSSDKGESWIDMNSSIPTKYIYSFTTHEGKLYAGTYDYGVIVSEDNGHSWTVYDTGFVDYGRISALMIHNDIIYAGAEQGMYSADIDNLEWNLIGLLTERVLSLAVKDELVIVGTYGTVYTTTDNGINWQKGGINSAKVNGIQILNSRIYAATDFGLLISDDDAITWKWQKTGWADRVNETILIVNDDIYLAQLTGTLYHSSDSGDTWRNPELSTNTIRSIVEINGEVLAGSMDSGIFASTDNGYTWTVRNNGLESLYITQLLTYNNKVYACTNDGMIHISTDNGFTWQKKGDVDSGKRINSIVSLHDNMFVGVEGGGIWGSYDEGLNWIKIQDSSYKSLTHIITDGENLYGFGKDNGFYIYKSEDYGLNWTKISSDLTKISTTSFYIHEGVMYMGGFESGFYVSYDEGESWKLRDKGIEGYYIGLIKSIGGYLFANSSVSNDNGNTWFSRSEGLRSGVQCLVEVGDYVFAGTYYGVYRTLFKDLEITSVNENSVNDIISVFPNPATEFIEISSHTINRRVDEIAEIKIFNTLGESIIELPDVQHLGDVGHLQRINISHLPRGVYYVRMGNRTEMFVKM